MKKFGNLKLFSLGIILLAGALVLIGINLLEAGKPPKWEWKALIPNKLLAAQQQYNCNLYGNPHGNPLAEPLDPEYITYENNDFVNVDFWTYEDEETGEFNSVFSLKIENTEKDNPMGSGYYSIGFRDIWFKGCKSYCFLGGEGPCLCWVLPTYPTGDTYLDPDGVDCHEGVVDCYGSEDETGSTGYKYMKQFMEEYNHPSCGYDCFSLRFWVNHDIETIEVGGYWQGEGYIWHLNLWNTGETLLNGDEKYHNIVPASWIPLEEVKVERSGENEWIITVDQCGQHDPGTNDCESYLTNNSGRYIVFWETYYQGIEKQKGKSGKTYIDSEYRVALRAATRFKFITKWTRSEKQKGKPS